MIYASVLKQNSTKLDSVPQEAKEIVVLETVQGGGIKGFASFLTLPIQSRGPPLSLRPLGRHLPGTNS